jgi:hypothetical protein
MRKQRALHPARAGALLLLSFVLFLVSARIDVSRADESDTCSAVTRDLRGQIEEIKSLNAAPPTLAPANPSKKHQPEAPTQTAARDRVQADMLNDMLPGMGCPRLDIDQELKQPANPSLLPAKASAKHKKQKHEQ